MDEAASTPEVPRMWRPRTVRMVAYGLGLLIVATFAVLAVILPIDWRPLDRVMLIGFGFVIAAGLHLLARPRLIAEEDRVLVVNGIRTHVLSWQEILDIQMPEGEPWPCVDLSDGTSLPVMGIQSTDGEPARQAVEDFRAMLQSRGEGEEPGLS
ncbi:PH domain-containing protein [Nocardiopsis sp. HNM0947]|uniref:PH domain-containing protein n=1 Tax=Nocardiopsis coralli TaxID=2772213 RepID=A0ABR9P0Q6_9ACTN|nr:PH domain-containing protein [Nocardiopsis coralli]MBE2997388.1 PH domain-containing protein [Nocardiopsis coralli]